MKKIVIVTGGSRGIGASVVRRAAQGGWDVCVNYAGNAAAAEQVCADVRAAGQRAVSVQADVADLGQVDAMFDACQAELGTPTGLVNNAGVATVKTRLDEISDADLRRSVEVNVLGSLYCARRAAQIMSTGNGGPGGVIVNISSMAVLLGAPGERVHYAASKGAIDALTLGLGRELAGEGVRVNAVRPGLIDTDMNRQADDPDRLARIAPSIPIRRTGTPEEVAEAVYWLMSDASSYVVGDIITVSGGR